MSLKIEMTTEGRGSIDTNRHRLGLFVKNKDHGIRKETMRSTRDTFSTRNELYLVANRTDLDSIICAWKDHPVSLLPPTTIAERLFPNHVEKPFFQKGDHPVPSDLDGPFSRRCELVFRNVQEYNMVVGWGAIVNQRVQSQIEGNGGSFKGRIHVFPVMRGNIPDAPLPPIYADSLNPGMRR